MVRPKTFLVLVAILSAVVFYHGMESYNDLPYSKFLWTKENKGYNRWTGKSRADKARKECDKYANKNKTKWFKHCKGTKGDGRRKCIQEARPKCLTALRAHYVVSRGESETGVKYKGAVALFREPDHVGLIRIHPSGNDAFSTAKEDDAVQSIWINPAAKHRITVYEDKNFGGRSKTFTKHAKNLGKWKNKISSYIIKAPNTFD